MTEEAVTKAILNWLLHNEWEIVCYDFPQSGTGRFLHPNGSKGKNKDSINPDIVAVKNDICVFFENKSYFYYSDFEKVEALRTYNEYSEDIEELLSFYDIHDIFYGIGYPVEAHKRKALKSLSMVDFVIGVNEQNEIIILYDKENCFDTKKNNQIKSF